jgi:hypothetical protein
MSGFIFLKCGTLNGSVWFFNLVKMAVFRVFVLCDLVEVYQVSEVLASVIITAVTRRQPSLYTPP